MEHAPDSLQLASLNFDMAGLQLGISNPEPGDWTRPLVEAAYTDPDLLSFGIATADLPRWVVLEGGDGTLRDASGREVARLHVVKIQAQPSLLVGRLLAST
jgi:hypothetical protein